ncbi:hypothetical protein GH714_027138 [Hevea brasiliensis]|uniref:EF-hand domain-containing protein n=1 Tax=Hevea brasiliensis TaxID=3981 RepID=A0A6A6L3D7_HEVBR|nr:hypothetical protein GH714_027138 [Hevea brasiliensis]
MDIDMAGGGGDAPYLDPELLQLPEVSPFVLKASPQIAEELFSQWLSLPGTSRLSDGFRDAFIKYWVDGNMLAMDRTTCIFNILKQPENKYLIQTDFKPVLRELLAMHPGLEFLQSTPEFQERYAETVIYRIFYYINRSGNGRLTLRELKRGNLVAAMQHADEEEDINKVLRFKCIDLDGNGVLTPNEMQFFYEEQLHRMECMAQEPVLFEDILCQIVDMIAPEATPDSF